MKTLYSLPYRVSVAPAGVYPRGEDLLLRLVFSTPVPDVVVERAAALVTGFEVLALSGALSGVNVRPQDSNVICLGPRRVSEDVLEWTLGECAIDPGAVAVIAQVFLCLDPEDRPAALSLAPPGFTGHMTVLEKGKDQLDVYPALHPSVREKLDVPDALSEDIRVIAVFAGHPDPDQQLEITGRVHAWLSGAMEGYYPVSPMHPEDCGVVYDGDIEYHDGELELTLSRFRCHVGASL